VTVALDLLLIPRYGIIGAAVASTCAYTVEFLVAGAFFLRHSSLPWKEVVLFRRADFNHYTAAFYRYLAR